MSVVSEAEASKKLKSIAQKPPEAVVVVGSGLELLTHLEQSKKYNYKEIFGIEPSVAGHVGTLEVGTLDGKLIAVLRGRYHLYEGHEFKTVSLPVAALAHWGASKLYLTNAAGALNAKLSVGDLMLITAYRDHLNPRWKIAGGLPSVSAKPVDCRNNLTESIWQKRESIGKGNSRLQQGIYVGVLGPCYETMAEVEMFKQLKADAIGMSTVPELQIANKKGMQVAAISVITNSWNASKIHGHFEVLNAAKAASQALDTLLQADILNEMDHK